MKNARLNILTVAALILIPIVSKADGGTSNAFTPYSKFGVGVINNQGTSYNRGMGGVGIAGRDNRFINVLNPAAVTARDSLAFMADFGVSEGNSYFRQGNTKSVHNTFNINNLVLSFPIWKSSAFMVGITPYSSVGYSFSNYIDDPLTTGHSGTVADAFTGTGSLYKTFIAAGVTFWKRLSIGAEFDYYFGNIEKSSMRSFTSSYYRTFYSGNQMVLSALGGKFGLQYSHPIGRNRLTAGATYSLPVSLRGQNEKITYTSQSSVTFGLDTISVDMNNAARVRIPSEIGVGVSFRAADKWMIEFDYKYADWTGSNFENVSGFSNASFACGKTNEFNIGCEIVPNRNDIRYYLRRCAYRFGAYHKQEYFTYCGREVSSTGITLGMTLPIFRWYNGLSLSLDFGQRGTLNGADASYNPIRERYVNVSVSLNVFDIWFVKPKYE